MPEARGSQRTRTLLGAKIIFNDRASVIDCVVRNISSSGAELALAAGAMGVPDNFELHIPSKCCSHRARLVWRDADGIGVVFYPDSKKRH
jgi:PilZ domain